VIGGGAMMCGSGWRIAPPWCPPVRVKGGTARGIDRMDPVREYGLLAARFEVGNGLERDHGRKPVGKEGPAPLARQGLDGSCGVVVHGWAAGLQGPQRPQQPAGCRRPVGRPVSKALRTSAAVAFENPTSDPTNPSRGVAARPKPWPASLTTSPLTSQDATAWDERRPAGTKRHRLRIRRLGVRIPPSAPEKSRSEGVSGLAVAGVAPL